MQRLEVSDSEIVDWFGQFGITRLEMRGQIVITWNHRRKVHISFGDSFREAVMKAMGAKARMTRQEMK